MTATVVLINFYSQSLIVNLINELSKLSYLNFVVVDNSHDFNWSADRTRIVRPSSNIGFGAGCNIGLSMAIDNTVVFINPDLNIDHSQMAKLIESYSDDCILGALVSQNGRATNLHRPGRFGLKYRRYIICKRGAQQRLMEVEFVSGACMILSKDIFKKCGGFPSQIFMYAEDLYLCRTAARHGIASKIVADVNIEHVGGASSHESSSIQKKLRRLKRSYQGHYAFLRMDGNGTLKSIFNAIHLASGRIF